MKPLKIVTLGGGSGYTPELIDGFIKRHAELPVSEYWLVDIETGREKLEIVGQLAQRMVKKAGIPMTVHLTTDRKQALKDADFVTTQIRVGQLAARIQDEKIPLHYGVLGQETTGPGGFMNCFAMLSYSAPFNLRLVLPEEIIGMEATEKSTKSRTEIA